MLGGASSSPTRCALTALNATVVTSSVLPGLALSDLQSVACVNRAHRALVATPAHWRARIQRDFPNADVAAAVVSLTARDDTKHSAAYASASATAAAASGTGGGAKAATAAAAAVDWRAVYRWLVDDACDSLEGMRAAIEREWPAAEDQRSPPARPFLLMKMVLVGDTGAGKTAVLSYFADGVRTNERAPFLPTIGVDFKIQRYVLPPHYRYAPSPGVRRVKLQIWDTAGPERFRSVSAAYYRGASALVLCVDPFDSAWDTPQARLDRLHQTLEDIRTRNATPQGQPPLPPPAVVLFATKTDLCRADSPAPVGYNKPRQRVLSEATLRAWAAARDIAYFETSAADGRGIVRGFRWAVAEVAARWQRLPPDEQPPLWPKSGNAAKPPAAQPKAGWSCGVQ